jgi:hypothetical protein
MKRFALLTVFAILITTGGHAFATDESRMATPLQAKLKARPQGQSCGGDNLMATCRQRREPCSDHHDCCSGTCRLEAQVCA